MRCDADFEQGEPLFLSSFPSGYEASDVSPLCPTKRGVTHSIHGSTRRVSPCITVVLLLDLLSRMQLTASFRIAVAITAVATSLANGQSVTIAIDPGHGGDVDSGSPELSVYNKSDSNHAQFPGRDILEKDLTLDLSKRIASAVAESPEGRAGKVRAVLTRTERESNPDFTQRVAVAAEAEASILLSIHFNADDKGVRTPSRGPVAVYYQKKFNPRYKTDIPIADALQMAVSATTNKFVPTPEGIYYCDNTPPFTTREKPKGSYLFYQAKTNPKTANIPVIYLEVEFLKTTNQERLEQLFVTQKEKVFDAWAIAIARVLIKSTI